MLITLFWILFAIISVWVAWGFLRMFLRDSTPPSGGGRAVTPSETGGTSGGSIDVSSGSAAESSGSDSVDSSASESSSGFESGGGEYGGGGSSGGW